MHLNAFTIDVEDYFHVSAFAGRIDPRTWDHFESRVCNNTHRLLRMLEHHQFSATFFILGWVAQKFPQLVRDIQKDGHEIGCHSFWHRLIYQMHPEEFRKDLKEAKNVIEDIIAQPVTAYRAPSFSITNQSLWALDILMEEGFSFDSSIFPIHHDRYGIPSAKPYPHTIRSSQGSLYEFPPSVIRLGKFNLPVSGGGYFRLYPYFLTQSLLRQINSKAHQPFMFYIHPWELDPQQPRLKTNFPSRMRHYLNLRTTQTKLEKLIDNFRFGTFSNVFHEQASGSKLHLAVDEKFDNGSSPLRPPSFNISSKTSAIAPPPKTRE